MTEEFKKWLCELAGIPYYGDENRTLDLLILIRAMLALNQEAHDEGTRGRYFIASGLCNWIVNYGSQTGFHEDIFHFDKYNNSGIEALEAALQYIFDNKE
jgi:hypothetical protein